jgi:hypothetical protein
MRPFLAICKSCLSSVRWSSLLMWQGGFSRGSLECLNTRTVSWFPVPATSQRNIADFPAPLTLLQQSGIVAKSESRSDRVRRARDRIESFQMASLSRRYHPLVRAVVPEVSDLICAYGRDGARTWSTHPLQLRLALGPNLRAGTGQALPPSPETGQ